MCSCFLSMKFKLCCSMSLCCWQYFLILKFQLYHVSVGLFYDSVSCSRDSNSLVMTVDGISAPSSFCVQIPISFDSFAVSFFFYWIYASWIVNCGNIVLPFLLLVLHCLMPNLNCGLLFRDMDIGLTLLLWALNMFFAQGHLITLENSFPLLRKWKR